VKRRKEERIETQGVADASTRGKWKEKEIGERRELSGKDWTR